MNIKEKKQAQQPLKQPFTKDELKEIFVQLKNTTNEEARAKYQALLYNAYMPFLTRFAKKYNVKDDVALDLYHDLFSKLYNTIWEGRQKPENFGIVLSNNLAKECLHAQALQNSGVRISSESLTNPKIAMEAIITEEKREKEKAFNRQSLLMVISILDEIEHDPELRQIYNITAGQIKVVRDFYGINEDNNVYDIEELARKYQKSELEIKGLLNSGMKQIRQIEEFDSIRKR